MKRRHLLIMFLLACTLLILPATALAGGWATVQIHEMPEELAAGEPFIIEFTVWQHGDKPVHELSLGDGSTMPITPIITLIHSETREKLSFAATPLPEKGRFEAIVTAPQEGSWEWGIAPDPLAGVVDLPALEVTPATQSAMVLQSAESAATMSNAILLAGAAMVVLITAGAGALLASRRGKLAHIG